MPPTPARGWIILRGNGEMALKRMVLQIGMGTDIRGADPTKVYYPSGYVSFPENDP